MIPQLVRIDTKYVDGDIDGVESIIKATDYVDQIEV